MPSIAKNEDIFTPSLFSGVDSRGAGGARAPPEFWDSEKGRRLISAYRSLAITASSSGFEKLSTALLFKFKACNLMIT